MNRTIDGISYVDHQTVAIYAGAGAERTLLGTAVITDAGKWRALPLAAAGEQFDTLQEAAAALVRPGLKVV